MKFFFKRGKILVFVIVGMMLVLSLNFFQKNVKGFFYFISAPVQRSLWQAGDNVSDFFEGLLSSGDLKKENDGLNLKNQQLLAENVFLKELKKENEILREALEIGVAEYFRLAFADVVAKDVGQDSILINQGSKNGLTEGMPVVSEQKVLLGKISEVYQTFSRITLISDKKSSFDVKIAQTDVAGVIKGKGDSNLELDFVSKDEQVENGDLIVSSSLGGIYPKGLLIGLVKEAKKSDIQPFYEIEVAPFFDAGATRSVFIILNF